MRRLKCLWLLGFLFPFSQNADAQLSYKDRVNLYVRKYKEMAMEEQRRSGVPASITLGQGVLETEAGNSILCTGANNHFGIKCKKEWKGETMTHTDDRPDECFRKYPCAKDSYKDHSDYLRGAPRYAALFQLAPTDYSGWAFGLKRSGYATNPVYAQKLIKIIEDFNLQAYTYTALSNEQISAPEVIPEEDARPLASISDVPVKKPGTGVVKPAAVPVPAAAGAKPVAGVQTVHGLKAIRCRKGELLLPVAIQYNLRYARLLEYNDLPDAPLYEDMYIYLEHKHTQGTTATRTLQPKESLHHIAQEEGMMLRELRIYNLLTNRETPVPGTVLNLQGLAKQKPELQPAAPVVVVVNNAPDAARSDKDYIAAGKPASVPAAAVPVAKPEARAAKPAEVPVKKPDVVTIEEPSHSETIAVVKAPASEEANTTEAGAVPESAPAEGFRIPPVTAQNAQPVQTAASESDTTEEDEIASLKSMLDRVVYFNKGNAAEQPQAKPEKAAVAETPVRKPAPVAAGAQRFHTVQKGDTAFNIAKKYGITVKQLQTWNKSDKIQTGQKVRVSM